MNKDNLIKPWIKEDVLNIANTLASYSVCFNRLIGTKGVRWRHCELISSWLDLTFFVQMYTNTYTLALRTLIIIYYLQETFIIVQDLWRKNIILNFIDFCLILELELVSPMQGCYVANCRQLECHPLHAMILDLLFSPFNWANSVTMPCTCVSRTSCNQPKVVQEPEMWAPRGRVFIHMQPAGHLLCPPFWMSDIPGHPLHLHVGVAA